jgi:hypothetical protein
MPREWGRDPFYTLCPEREGFGDVNAIMTKVQYTSPKTTFKSYLLGYFDLPDTKNFELNKYGFLIFRQMQIFSTNFRVLKVLTHIYYTMHKFNVGAATKFIFKPGNINFNS